MNRRPLIAITGPDRGGWPAWICTRIAILRAGGKALRLTPARYAEERELPAADGWIIGGGADVDPARYGEGLGDVWEGAEEAEKGAGLGTRLGGLLFYLLRKAGSLSAAGMDPARDAFEQRCLETALQSGMPVLGICRGAQFINIHFGGSLHTDLGGFYGEAGNRHTIYAHKPVQLDQGSRLRQVLQRDAVRVNSLHKQAVNRLGDQISACAHDRAGVIQAIEHATAGFIIGVQWHPEYLPLRRVHQRIFKTLVDQARRVRSASPSLY